MFDMIFEKSMRILKEGKDHLDDLHYPGKRYFNKQDFANKDDEKYQYFLDRTNKHIELVKKAARKIV